MVATKGTHIQPRYFTFLLSFPRLQKLVSNCYVKRTCHWPKQSRSAGLASGAGWGIDTPQDRVVLAVFAEREVANRECTRRATSRDESA